MIIIIIKKTADYNRLRQFKIRFFSIILSGLLTFGQLILRRANVVVKKFKKGAYDRINSRYFRSNKETCWRK